MEEEELIAMTPVELLQFHLVRAEQHASQAMDLLYKRDKSGVQRSYLYRLLLNRAQSILMSLVVRELGKKKI